MSRLSFRDGVIYGVFLAADDTRRARQVREWRLNTVTIIPEKFAKTLVLAGAVIECCATQSQHHQIIAMVGFVVLLTGGVLQC